MRFWAQLLRRDTKKNSGVAAVSGSGGASTAAAGPIDVSSVPQQSPNGPNSKTAGGVRSAVSAATAAELRRASAVTPQSSNAPTPNTADGMSDEAVTRIVDAMMARHTAQTEGTFETSGKDIKSIVCSDDECPCTDEKPLALGKDAHLYISPGVVDYRKDCLSLLELQMKVSRGKSPQDTLNAVRNSMPKFVCETGARRRGLDLAVALADGLAAARTGFVPLRV
jgi:hypothetical protein